MKCHRYKSIYIDLYTGYIGSATDFEHYPAARRHRFLFVGYHKRTPAINGRIIKQLKKQHGLNLEIKPVPRKQIFSDNEENYF